jgi:hypothetical protein
MWLVRRALGVGLILIAICAGTVLVARANGGQDRLQAMGFGACDGEPCFRGIKVGMRWSEAKRVSPDASEIGLPIVVNFDGMDETVVVYNYSSGDGKTVLGTILETNSFNTRLSVADAVRHFGPPCRVELDNDYLGRSGAVLIYPRLKSRVFVVGFRFSLDSTLYMINISEPIDTDPCSGVESEYSGPWRGFTSGEVYLARNRRALGMTPTP